MDIASTEGTSPVISFSKRGLLPALMAPKKIRIHDLAQCEGICGSVYIPFIRTGLGPPENTILAVRPMYPPARPKEKSLAWLKPKNETMEAARHDG